MLCKIMETSDYVTSLFKGISFVVDGVTYDDLAEAIQTKVQKPRYAIAKIQREFTDQEYTKLYTHKLKIEQLKYGDNDPKNVLIENFPEWETDINSFFNQQSGHPKGIGMWLMQRMFLEMNLLPISDDIGESPVERMNISLYDHGFTEWKIIQALLNDSLHELDSSFYGIQYKDNRENLANFWKNNKHLFSNIDTKLINNFLWPFLLLHDIGKYNKGDDGHLGRSRETILNLDLSNIMTDEDKHILADLAGYHSDVEKIFKDSALLNEIKIFLNKIPDKKRADIVKVWILFRISERAFSELFGFMDEAFWKMIIDMYNELMSQQ